MGLRGPNKVEWPRGDYAGSILFRFLLLFALWGFYGMIDNALPLSALLFVTAILAVYAFVLFGRGNALMGWLMVAAAGLNTLLIPLLAAANQQNKFGFSVTGLPIIIIFAILLFDIVNIPRKE
jgi:hypothetical protein